MKNPRSQNRDLGHPGSRGRFRMADADHTLREFASAIIAGDADAVSRQLAASPELARARFAEGATRREAQAFFLKWIERYIGAGDTALHIAAAAYQTGLVGH